MMNTKANITSHEFVGMYTQIVGSSNPQIVGMYGRIIDETKSMFVLETKKGIKLVAKSENSWKFVLEEGSTVVNGSDIQKRPFDRIGGRKA